MSNQFEDCANRSEGWTKSENASAASGIASKLKLPKKGEKEKGADIDIICKHLYNFFVE